MAQHSRLRKSTESSVDFEKCMKILRKPRRKNNCSVKAKETDGWRFGRWKRDSKQRYGTILWSKSRFTGDCSTGKRRVWDVACTWEKDSKYWFTPCLTQFSLLMMKQYLLAVKRNYNDLYTSYIKYLLNIIWLMVLAKEKFSLSVDQTLFKQKSQ